MGDGAVDMIGHERAARAGRIVVGAEHEMKHEQLRAPVEELRERLRAFVGLEAVGLLDGYPWQFLSLARELVTPPRELLLALEQRGPGGEPLFAGSHFVLCHYVSLLGRL